MLAVVTTKTSQRENSKRYDVVAISALGTNDTAFAEDDDSGSIYYASRGSFRYPFAIHNGQGFDKTPDLFPVPEKHTAFVTRKVYYGTRSDMLSTK